MAKGDSRGVPGVGTGAPGSNSFTSPNSGPPPNYQGSQGGQPSVVPSYQNTPSMDNSPKFGGLLPPMQGTPDIKGGDLGGIDNDALLKLLQQLGLMGNDPNRARTMMGPQAMGMGQGNRSNLSQFAGNPFRQAGQFAAQQRGMGNMGGGFGRPPVPFQSRGSVSDIATYGPLNNRFPMQSGPSNSWTNIPPAIRMNPAGGGMQIGGAGGFNPMGPLPNSYPGFDMPWQSGGQVYSGMTGKPMGPVGGGIGGMIKPANPASNMGSILPTPQGNTGITGGMNRSYAPQYSGRPY